MFAAQSDVSDHRITHTDAVTLAPIQYALLNQDVMAACQDFYDDMQHTTDVMTGAEATGVLSGCAETFLRNNIGVGAISTFSTLSLTQRAKQHDKLSQDIQAGFNDFIRTHLPEIISLNNFTLSLENDGTSISVRLTPDFVFSVGTLWDAYDNHPLRYGLTQLTLHLADTIGVCNHNDLIGRVESEIEYYVTIVNSQEVLHRIDDIEQDVLQFYATENEDKDNIDALNEKWAGVITFEHQWISPELIESIHFFLEEERIQKTSLNELHHWVTNEIDRLALFTDPQAIQLLDDINTLSTFENSMTSLINDSDDALFNTCLLLPSTARGLSHTVCNELDQLSEYAWQLGMDCYYTIDTENKNWIEHVNLFAQCWTMVERYMCIDY